ncbi:GNAT family N-acetyltransferase [Dermatophilaceae bacterium Sec6.4]
MVIRPCDVLDAEALTDLHLDVWEEAYAGLIPSNIFAARRSERRVRVERWRQIIASGSSRNLLIEDDHVVGRLLGFSSTGVGRDGPETDLPAHELMALYVRADVYGRGVGYELLQAALGRAGAYLWVLDGNTRAITFYERQGFVFDGTTKSADVGLERRMVRRTS